MGQTGRPIKTRFREHLRNCRNKKLRHFLYQHFRRSGHDTNFISFQPIEHLYFDNNATSRFKSKARFVAELNWIKKLQTPFPLGLNDNIYQSGNISRDHSIDIFSIFDARKRKSRSHGTRKNGNIRRKSRILTSLADLHLLRVQCGTHKMLSQLCTLPIAVLRVMDREADKVFLQSDPYYKTAIIVQNYTQHILVPHIDSLSHHKRHFIKIPFINKGIDFIDLQSIIRNKNVQNAIPKYFKNLESPIICYKYNKPTRSIIFNYNKIVSDLNIKDNTPKT